MLALIDGSVIFICNDVIPLFTETNIFLRLLHVKYYSVFRGRTRADCRCEQIARFGDDQKEKKSLEIWLMLLLFPEDELNSNLKT